MRNRYAHIIAVLAAALTLAACEFRPLYIEHETPVEVIVNTEWTQLGSIPEGSSIYFYRESDKKCIKFQTNSVTRTIVEVPAGYWTVMVFNRSEAEYGSLKFGETDALGTARAILEDKLFSWVGRADTIGRTVYEPEEIVIGRTDHFQVRSMTERENYLWNKNIEYEPGEMPVIDSVQVLPKQVRYIANVKVRINGLQNLKSVRGYLKGMAGSDYMATRTSTDETATHVMESWTATKDVADYTKGYINSTFYCFGLPEQALAKPLAENNRILLKFLLVDEETIITKAIDVGDLIKQNDTERTDDLVIETAITLPDVKPKGGSSSGFDVDFTDWDDPEDVPIGI